MLKRLSISGWKLFLSGKGLSFRTGKYFGEAMLVGAATGFVVVAFRCMIDFCDVAARVRGLDGARWIMLVLPAAGALLGHLLIKRFDKLEHARGTDSAVKAYHQHGGYITSTAIPVKSAASVLTVGFGGSAGYEGPVTLIGAACGSVVARILKLSVRARRILMAAGLAGGIGALFQAPLAGAIFGFEIFYSSSDVEYETLLPSFIASAVSYTVYAYFFGWNPLFSMPECAFENGLRLLPYFVLAVIVAFGARIYISFFRTAETRFGDLALPGWLKVVAGGLATGAIGFFVPEILGPGYGIIEAALSAKGTMLVFFGFFLLKVVATSFTVGSGGSGGVFAPALVCGGSLGAATGIFFERILPEAFGINPAAFALVGMAGFLASAIRIPMASIVMVAEISGNHSLLLPAMWVCGIAFWLNNGWTMYRSQPHSRESSPVHR
ncbi:MAG: chloride channel protein [Kiritimatiellae bacterium]|nr:chloride channel protein [Kiritimatiellia bacterium]